LNSRTTWVEERAARALVSRAAASGYGAVTVGSCGNYGLAVALACQHGGLRATIVVPGISRQDLARLRATRAEVLAVDGTYEDAVVAGGWPTRVVGVSSSGNNSVLASWPSTRHRPIPSAAVRDTPANQPLVNWDALHGPQALAALHATGGQAIGVSDEELTAAAGAVHATCRLAVTPSGAAGVAAACRLLAAGDADQTHVAVLTGSRPSASIAARAPTDTTTSKG